MPVLLATGAILSVALPVTMVLDLDRRTRLRSRVTETVVRNLTKSLGVRAFLPFGIEWLLYYRRHRFFISITERHRYDGDVAIPLAELREKNLVFTVTAGRTGTLFAQQLFALLPDTTSLHEPAPAFHAYLRRIKRDHDFPKDFLLHYKLPFIADLPSRNYVELSHVFCKGFLEPLLDLR
jgi:hypothetical protein